MAQYGTGLAGSDRDENPHGLVEGMKVDVTIGGARNGSIGG